MKRSSILRYKIFAPAVAVLGLLTTVLTPLPGAFADSATPTISSFLPTSGGTGTHVIIQGTHMNGVTQVTFGGTAATSFVIDSGGHSIDAVVGAGSTGFIALVDPAHGDATSTGTFTFEAPGPFTLTYTAGPHGSISGVSPQTVASLGSGTPVTAVADTGYHFVNWSDTSTANPRTDTLVVANISVTANFAINTYTLTYTAGTGGTIVGTSPQTVNYGANGTTVTATPNATYHFVAWSDAYPTAARTDLNVQADLTVHAIFALDGTFTLHYTAGPNGSIVGNDYQIGVLPHANGTTVTATPNSGFHFVSWSDGYPTAVRTDLNVLADVNATASFAADSIVKSVTFLANGGSGSMSVQTSSVPASLTPNAFTRSGYIFANWNVNANGSGVAYVNGATYSFAADLTLYAQWTFIGVIVPVPVVVPWGSPAETSTAPPAAPPTPIAQAPLVLTAVPLSVPLPAFAALSTTGGSGSGVVTYSTSTPVDCVVDAVHGLVTGIIAGTCTVIATKAADGTYLQQVSNPVDISFFVIPVAPEPPAASPGLPATGLFASVVRTVTVSGSALSKVIKVNLGASVGGKKVTVQIRNARTSTYRTLCVVTLNKFGVARFTRLVPKGSAIRVLVGGRSLAATIVR